MCTVYFVNIEQFSDEDIANSTFFIIEERMKKALRFKQKDDVKRSICASLLINCFFHDFEKIEYNAYGKPYFKESELFFNISHSGNWVVLGISEKEIGVDIEEIPLKPNSISYEYFSEEEKSFLKSFRDKDIKNIQKHFIRLWTRKEAYMKYVGRGITDEFLKLNMMNDTVNECQISSFLFDNQYYITICTEEKNVVFNELSIDCLFNYKLKRKR